MAVMHFLCLVTYLTNKPSTRNQFRWGSGGRSRRLCSPRERVAAAPAESAAPSRAGTPTVYTKTNAQSACVSNHVLLCCKNTSFKMCPTHQQILCQGYFLWYFQIYPSSYITSLKKQTHGHTWWYCSPENKMLRHKLWNKEVPAGGVLTPSPAHRHRSGCSV